jgi:4-hydroxy-2-oxoheptanedioate aldolase
MRPNALKKKLADGQRCVGGWVAIPSAFSTEIYAAQGWDYVTLDMQHGSINPSDVVPLLQAITAAGDATPLARVPWNDPAYIMRVLDAGAYGIVCPMINTKAEAEALVRAGRYPPLGERSFGPFRAAQYGGPDYYRHANEEVLLFAMIETRQAVSNLEEILSVKGINGVYIGPSDLSFSMGKTPTLDPSEPDVLTAMDIILKQTRQWGHIAGVHTDGPKTAQKRFAEGFQMCTVLNDVRLLATAAANAVREARGQGAGAAPAAKTY